MWHLFQFPLCPFSRKVRLLLAEKGIAYELKRITPWEENEDYYAKINPTGRTPAMQNTETGQILCDSWAICEYFEETVDKSPMISGTAANRAEIRRLTAWFDEQFYGDVVAPLMQERVTKRLAWRQPPDGKILREAMRLANTHFDYIHYLVDHRPWIGGATLSLADFAAAAHISVADYLGGIDWDRHEPVKAWYSVFKCRPSFRPLLSERMEVINPPKQYDQIDY